MNHIHTIAFGEDIIFGRGSSLPFRAVFLVNGLEKPVLARSRNPRGVGSDRVNFTVVEHEGRQIGRAPLNIDRAGLVRDRRGGMSLTKVSKKYGVSRASVCRIVNLAQAEYHAVDATHLPLDMVKPVPVLVA
jgi:hypothetical protein